jgi:acyl-coenzyme A synthetase/AMP-(fatty) acid ligase
VLTTYFSPAVLIKTIEDEQITGLAGIPFIWSQLVATRWPSAPSPLRYITNSGGALNQAVIKALSELLPSTKIFCMYGLTEAFRSTYLDPANLFTRPGSIGMAVPNQEVFVLRPDGTPCGTDEIGELVHRGSFVTHGYWNDAAHTAQRFRRLPAAAAGPGHGSEICVWSGDLVRRDADGYIYFVGRADEQIKSSGVRISPTEVEEVIGEVEGVIETVVVGIPDSKLGQVVAALAIVGAERDHEALGERIREHCRLHLPRIMSPSVLQFVTDLPRTENGKPDRAAAKQLLSSTELCTPDCGAQRDSNGPIDD